MNIDYLRKRVILELREKIVYAKYYILFQFETYPTIELFQLPIDIIFRPKLYKIFKFVMLHKNHRLIDYKELDPNELS